MFFVAHVEVCMDIGGGCNSRVPEELGYLKQLCPVAEKNAREGVSEVMEHDMPQPVLLEEELIMLCHVVRSEEFSGADKIVILAIIAAFEHLFIEFLALFDFKKCFDHFIGDYDGSMTRFVFHLGYHLDHVLIVDSNFDHL